MEQLESTLRIAYWLRWSDDAGRYKALIFALDEDDLDRKIAKLHEQSRFFGTQFNVEEAK